MGRYDFLNEKKMQKGLELMDIGAICINAEGKIIWNNLKAETMFVYAPGEMEGKVIETLLPKDMQAKHKEWREAYMRNPTSRPMAHKRIVEGVTKFGASIRVSISICAFADKEEMFAWAFINEGNDG